jgi:hypothetical protein
VPPRVTALLLHRLGDLGVEYDAVLRKVRVVWIAGVVLRVGFGSAMGFGGLEGCVFGEEVLADHFLILNLSGPVRYYHSG